MGAAVAIPLIVAAAGAATSVYSADQARKGANKAMDAQTAATEEAAAWNAAISRGDAEIARRSAKNIEIQGNKDLGLKMAELLKMRSTIKSGFASRGVAVNTGSALNHQQVTSKAVLNDMNAISYSVKLQMSKAYSEAERYELMAEAGMMQAANQAHAYEEAAATNAKNIMTQGYTGAVDIIGKAAMNGAFNNLFSNASSYTALPASYAGTTDFFNMTPAASASYTAAF